MAKVTMITTTKLETLIVQLQRTEGTSIADMVKATGWQLHSVRGALAGTLKKKGHVISSDVVDGVRRYRAAVAK
jgi:hypothetical protein